MKFLTWLSIVSVIGTLWSLLPIGPAHADLACFPRPLGKTMQRMVPGATLNIELFEEADKQGYSCRDLQALATLQVQMRSGTFEARLFSCTGVLLAKASQIISAQSEETHVISLSARPLDCGTAQARLLFSDSGQPALMVETAPDGMAVPGLAGRIS